MKKHSMPDMKEGGVNVTPLIDIIMCLIVFFMLVTKVGVSRGVDKDIKLPNALLGTKIADMGNTFSLNVHHSPLGDPQITAQVGSAMVEVKLTDGKDQPLLRVLKEFKSTHKDKAEVIIRGDGFRADDAHKDEADKDLTYGELEMVLMAIATAGITDTAYETKVGPNPSEAAAVAQ